MIPSSYSEWRRCIEVDCGLALTPDFIQARLRALADPADFHTEQFLRRYGQAHHRRVLDWFGKAQRELDSAGA